MRPGRDPREGLQSPHDGAPLQCFRQFRPRCECLFGFLVCHPLSASLVFLGPVIGLLLNADLEKLENRRGCVWSEFVRGTSVLDLPKVFQNCAFDACLFPGFTTCGFLDGFVRLPATLRKDPTAAAGRLDKEDLGLVAGERDHACNQTLALGAVTYSREVSARYVTTRAIVCGYLGHTERY